MTTHDLPALAGLWTGSDLQLQRELGLKPNEEGTQQIRQRLASMAGVSDKTPIEEVIRRTYGLLAQAPSFLVTATIDDALAVKERPNMPGAAEDRHPNWSLALPSLVEDLQHNDVARSIAEVLNRR